MFFSGLLQVRESLNLLNPARGCRSVIPALAIDRWTHPCWDSLLCHVVTMKAEGWKHGLLWVTTSPRSQAPKSRRTQHRFFSNVRARFGTLNMYGTFKRHRVVNHPTVRLNHSHFGGNLWTSTGTCFNPRWHHGIPSGIPTTPDSTKWPHFSGEILLIWVGISRVVKRMSSGSIRPTESSVSRMGFLATSLDVRWCKFSVSWEPLMSDEQCSKPWLGSSSGIIPNILGIPRKGNPVLNIS